MKSSYQELRNAQRQHINLSRYALDVITQDSLEFMGQENTSGFINRIIENFYETAAASISLELERYQQYLSTTLLSNMSAEAAAPAIESLVNQRRYELSAGITEYPRQVPLKIRLNNTIYDLLYPSDFSPWPEHEFYPAPYAYLKALLEEYSRKPLYNREAIYYKNHIDIISNELSRIPTQRRLLSVKYMSKAGHVENYIVKAYQLTSPVDSTYHYLVGLSTPANSKSKTYVPATFRISRIESIRPCAPSLGSGKITQIQLAELQDAIRTKGISFLIDHTETIRVQLTERGLQMFRSILHLRPDIFGTETCESGHTVLTFKCTQSQIKYYFFRFGKEAKILHPKALANEFKKKYQQAYSFYEEE